MLGIVAYRVSLQIRIFPQMTEIPQAVFNLIASVSAGFINLIFILVLGRLYAWVAVKLTEIGIISQQSTTIKIKFLIIFFF